MGWLPRRCSPGLDYLPMKTLLAVLLLAFAGAASAASVAMKPPVGITGNPASSTGWTTAANFVGNFSAASFSGGFTTNVGGKAVIMPASMRMAANAGQFAISAVRLNPAALVGSAVVAWLLSQGIEYIDGQWKKKDSSDNGSPIEGKLWYHTVYQSACTTSSPCSWSQVKTDFETKYGKNLPKYYIGGARITGTCTSGASSAQCPFEYQWNDGKWYSGGVHTFYVQASANPQYVPATEADFAPLATAPLPDAVANELAPKGVALPMENPQFNPPYVDEPLGEPYVDPVTGKRYQDKARVTPRSDGKTADVQIHKQQVDEQGNPATDETTGKEVSPEEQDDFCKQNPDSLACMEEGETDDIDLETRSVGSSVSPVALGSPGHCMADKTLSLSTLGRSFTFTYKPICDLASMVRPLILAIAWLLAGWIMVGAVRET